MSLTTKHEWKRLFKKYKIDSSAISSNVAATGNVKLKNFALKLYYSNFINLGACENIYYLMELNAENSVDDTRNLLLDITEDRKRHKFKKICAIHYTNNTDAIKHMKELSIGTDEKSVISLINPTRKIKSQSPKPVAVVHNQQKVSTSNILNLKLSDLKDMAVKKKIKGRSKMNKDELIRVLLLAQAAENKCKDYTLTDLKKIASYEKISGRSKMNRNELCKALKIKI